MPWTAGALAHRRGLPQQGRIPHADVGQRAQRRAAIERMGGVDVVAARIARSRSAMFRYRSGETNELRADAGKKLKTVKGTPFTSEESRELAAALANDDYAGSWHCWSGTPPSTTRRARVSTSTAASSDSTSTTSIRSTSTGSDLEGDVPVLQIGSGSEQSAQSQHAQRWLRFVWPPTRDDHPAVSRVGVDDGRCWLVVLRVSAVLGRWCGRS